MRHLPKLHLLLFVLTWVFAMTWGTAGMLVVTGGLTVLQLLMWRIDLAQLDRFRRSWRPRRGGGRAAVPSYDAVRHAIVLGGHSRREFDFGLRRRLERIAGTRLDHGHGVDLHRDPAAAQDLLGAEAWDLLDPHRPISTDRIRGGVPPQALARIVDRLERL